MPKLNPALTAWVPQAWEPALVSGGGVFALNSTMIAIGDSITYTSACAGLFEYAAALSGGRYSLLRNAGVNGNTTTQMAARFATDVVAYAPNYVAIMGHVNNLGASISSAQTVIDYTTMITAARAAGIIPIIVTAPPYNTSPSTLQAYNRALWRLAQTLRVQFVDPWQDSIDASNGNFLSGYSSDGTHPTQTSLRLAAIRFNAALTLPTYQPLLPALNGDTANKISNGLFLTNTVAGKPDGWTIDAAFTSSLSAASLPALGNYFNLAFTALAGYKVASGPISFSGLVAGDTCALVGRIKTVGFEANGNGSSPGQGKVDASTVIQFSGPGGGVYLSNSQGIGADIDGVFSTIFTLPAGTVGLSLVIAIGPRSGTIAGTYSMAQLGIFKL